MIQNIRIKMLENVRPELLFLAKPGTILREGMEYDATTNQHGAVSGICENGETMGVKPGEFEFVDAPDWLLEIHNKLAAKRIMKAVTLWQPWASLLACGAKKYETRSWSTSYRGPIAIHAAARPTKHGVYTFDSSESFAALLIALREAKVIPAAPLGALAGYMTKETDALPTSAIVATAELVGCWDVFRLNADSAVLERFDEDGNHFFRDITGNELIFGNFAPGRYAWEFANITMLPEPIPAKGGQRLWNWEGSA